MTITLSRVITKPVFELKPWLAAEAMPLSPRTYQTCSETRTGLSPAPRPGRQVGVVRGQGDDGPQPGDEESTAGHRVSSNHAGVACHAP